MGKSIIKNKIANKVYSFNVPCNDTKAATFAGEFLEGEYSVLAEKGTTGTDTIEPYNLVSLMIKNSANKKTYINLAVKATTTEDEIYAVFAGKTVNGVKADDLAVIKMQSM